MYKWLGKGPPLSVPIPDMITIDQVTNNVKYISSNTKQNHLIEVECGMFDSYQTRDQFLINCLRRFIIKSQAISYRSIPSHYTSDVMTKYSHEQLYNRFVAILKKPLSQQGRMYSNQQSELLLPFALQSHLDQATESQFSSDPQATTGNEMPSFVPEELLNPNPLYVIQKFVKCKGKKPSLYRVFWRLGSSDQGNAECWNITNDQYELDTPELLASEFLDFNPKGSNNNNNNTTNNNMNKNLNISTKPTNNPPINAPTTPHLTHSNTMSANQFPSGQITTEGSLNLPPTSSSSVNDGDKDMIQLQQQATLFLSIFLQAGIKREQDKQEQEQLKAIQAMKLSLFEGSQDEDDDLPSPTRTPSRTPNLSRRNTGLMSYSNLKHSSSHKTLDSPTALLGRQASTSNLRNSPSSFSPYEFPPVDLNNNHLNSSQLQRPHTAGPLTSRSNKSLPNKKRPSISEYILKHDTKSLNRIYFEGIQSKLHLTGNERSEAFLINNKASSLYMEKNAINMTNMMDGTLNWNKADGLILTKIAPLVLAIPLEHAASVANWIQCCLQYFYNITTQIEELVADFIKDEHDCWWLINVKGFKWSLDSVPRIRLWHKIHVLNERIQLKERPMTAKERTIKHSVELGIKCKLCGLYYSENQTVSLAEIPSSGGLEKLPNEQSNTYPSKDMLPTNKSQFSAFKLQNQSSLQSPQPHQMSQQHHHHQVITHIPAYGYQLALKGAMIVSKTYAQYKFPLTKLSYSLVNQQENSLTSMGTGYDSIIICCYVCKSIYDKKMEVDEANNELYSILNHSSCSSLNIPQDNGFSLTKLEPKYSPSRSGSRPLSPRNSSRPKSAPSHFRRPMHRTGATTDIPTNNNSISYDGINNPIALKQKNTMSYHNLMMKEGKLQHWRLFVIAHGLVIEASDSHRVDILRNELLLHPYTISYTLGQNKVFLPILWQNMEEDEPNSTNNNSINTNTNTNTSAVTGIHRCFLPIKQCRIHSFLSLTKANESLNNPVTLLSANSSLPQVLYPDIKSFLASKHIGCQLARDDLDPQQIQREENEDIQHQYQEYMKELQKNSEENDNDLEESKYNFLFENTSSQKKKQSITSSPMILSQFTSNIKQTKYPLAYLSFDISLDEFKLTNQSSIATGYEKIDHLLTLYQSTNDFTEKVTLNLSVAMILDDHLPTNLNENLLFLVERNNIFWPECNFKPAGCIVPSIWLHMLNQTKLVNQDVNGLSLTMKQRQKRQKEEALRNKSQQRNIEDDDEGEGEGEDDDDYDLYDDLNDPDDDYNDLEDNDHNTLYSKAGKEEDAETPSLIHLLDQAIIKEKMDTLKHLQRNRKLMRELTAKALFIDPSFNNNNNNSKSIESPMNMNNSSNESNIIYENKRRPSTASSINRDLIRKSIIRRSSLFTPANQQLRRASITPSSANALQASTTIAAIQAATNLVINTNNSNSNSNSNLDVRASFSSSPQPASSLFYKSLNSHESEFSFHPALAANNMNTNKSDTYKSHGHALGSIVSSQQIIEQNEQIFDEEKNLAETIRKVSLQIIHTKQSMHISSNNNRKVSMNPNNVISEETINDNTNTANSTIVKRSSLQSFSNNLMTNTNQKPRQNSLLHSALRYSQSNINNNNANELIDENIEYNHEKDLKSLDSRQVTKIIGKIFDIIDQIFLTYDEILQESKFDTNKPSLFLISRMEFILQMMHRYYTNHMTIMHQHPELYHDSHTNNSIENNNNANHSPKRRASMLLKRNNDQYFSYLTDIENSSLLPLTMQYSNLHDIDWKVDIFSQAIQQILSNIQMKWNELNMEIVDAIMMTLKHVSIMDYLPTEVDNMLIKTLVMENISLFLM